MIGEASPLTTRIMDAAEVGILVLDAEGSILLWNDWISRHSGVEVERARGSTLDALFPELASGRLMQVVADALKLGMSAMLSHRLHRSPFPLYASELERERGKRIQQTVFIKPFSEGAGRQCLIQINDVTNAVERERQLTAARRAAEKASRAKSEFLANMSHEIRTPMNGVIGMLQLLASSRLDEVQRGYVETALYSADLQLTVINDILDFSKIEAERLDLEQIEFSLRDTVEKSVEVTSGHAREKGLELSLAIDPALPGQVIGDPTRIGQILVNLTTNAVKFTASGGVEVAVEPRPKGMVAFAVKDSGIGIEPESLKRLFKPFTQGDGSTTRRFGGTGLGLAISKKLVDAMGGEIEVESRPGEGSRFYFTLPLPAVESAERQEKGRVANPVGRSSPALPDDGRAERLDAGLVATLRTNLAAIPGGFVQVINAFLVDGEASLVELEESLKAGDAERLHRAARGLKSQSATVGAKVLAELCRELEVAGREGRLEGMLEPVTLARNEFEAAIPELYALQSENHT